MEVKDRKALKLTDSPELRGPDTSTDSLSRSNPLESRPEPQHQYDPSSSLGYWFLPTEGRQALFHGPVNGELKKRKKKKEKRN